MTMADSEFSFDVSTDQFQSRVLDASTRVPVLVDFWAAWCAPCRALKPMLEALAADYNGAFMLAKVDTESEQGLAAHYGIRSLPTVKLFKDGHEVDQFMGALPEATVRELLDRHLQAVPKLSDQLREQAHAALDAGDIEGALALLRQAAAEAPADPSLAIELARLLLDSGDPDAARQAVAGLPADAAERADLKALQAALLFGARPAGDLAELRRRCAAEPTDYATGLQLADALVQAGDYAGAMDQLLLMVGRDDGSAKQRMLAVFDLIDDDALVSGYRRRLSNALY